MSDYVDLNLLLSEINEVGTELNNCKIIRQRNIARLLLNPYDISEGIYLKIFADAISTPKKTITIPSDMINILKGDYEADLKLAAEKFRIVSCIKYIDLAIESVEPLFENMGAVTTRSGDRYLITLKNVQIGISPMDVFVCKDSDLNNTKDGFIVYHGIATNEGQNVLIILSHCDTKDAFELDKNITVFKKPSVRQFEDDMAGVAAFTNCSCVEAKLFPYEYQPVLLPDPQNSDSNPVKKFTITDYKKLPRRPTFTDEPVYIPYCSLNDRQINLVKNMVNCDKQNAMGIIGSPGTGKTACIVSFVETQYHADRNLPILILAPTNKALDEIAERLLNRGHIPKDRMRRLVARSQPYENVPPIVREQICLTTFDNKTQNIVFYVPRKADKSSNVSIMFCTIGLSPRLKKLGNNHFKTVIIDESGQADECEIAAVVSNFCEHDTPLFLIGDDCQLGKVMCVKSLSRYEHYINLSPLTRLKNTKVYKEFEELLFMLYHNHRSDENIVKIFSTLSYEGKLIATNPVGHDSLYFSQTLAGQKVPIRWHECKGHELETIGTKRNEKEADLVVKYINDLVQKDGVKLSEIGVITPYNGQIKLINKKLNEARIKGVKVDTVAKFQGSQKRVMIISFVRTQRLGFLRDSRRINTAISRAMEMLIMIGDSNILKQSNYLNQMIELLKDDNLFYDPPLDI